MDFQPTPDQRALIDAVEQIVAKPRALPRDGHFFAYSEALDEALRGGGFLQVACEEGMGALEAALVVEAACKSPFAAETAASALVAPMVMGETIPGPIALMADAKRAARFLPMAKNAFILDGDSAVLLEVANLKREPVESLMAYPMGRFETAPDLAGGRRLTAAQTEKLLTWWRIAIAVEACGAMQAAVGFTADYVTTRRQFKRPLGSFQAIQHRLSECTVYAQGSRWLALEAAWKGDAASAALAATYAQRAIRQIVHDMHQFNGALGITLEHPLHYWTYRLTALQAELGGSSRQAIAAAEHLWLREAS
jgi:alkylation response protein AidB-like acyl-CoA dehydrogenase